MVWVSLIFLSLSESANQRFMDIDNGNIEDYNHCHLSAVYNERDAKMRVNPHIITMV